MRKHPFWMTEISTPADFGRFLFSGDDARPGSHTKSPEEYTRRALVNVVSSRGCGYFGQGKGLFRHFTMCLRTCECHLNLVSI